MARYGCLVISVIIALLILVVTVWFWSGWLNRPTGHAPAAQAAAPAAPAQPDSRVVDGQSFAFET